MCAQAQVKLNNIQNRQGPVIFSANEEGFFVMCIKSWCRNDCGRLVYTICSAVSSYIVHMSCIVHMVPCMCPAVLSIWVHVCVQLYCPYGAMYVSSCIVHMVPCMCPAVLSIWCHVCVQLYCPYGAMYVSSCIVHMVPCMCPAVLSIWCHVCVQLYCPYGAMYVSSCIVHMVPCMCPAVLSIWCHVCVQLYCPYGAMYVSSCIVHMVPCMCPAVLSIWCHVCVQLYCPYGAMYVSSCIVHMVPCMCPAVLSIWCHVCVQLYCPYGAMYVPAVLSIWCHVCVQLYCPYGAMYVSCDAFMASLCTVYVKSPPTITITSGTLGGDPSGCSRLTGVATSGADLCPFVGETLSVACKGAGVTVMKNRVSLNVSTLALQVSGVGDSGNYSCGDGGLCDAAQSTKSIAVFSKFTPKSQLQA